MFSAEAVPIGKGGFSFIIAGLGLQTGLLTKAAQCLRTSLTKAYKRARTVIRVDGLLALGGGGGGAAEER